MQRLQSHPSSKTKPNLRSQQAGGASPLAASLLGSEALLRTLIGHGSTINALAVLPDGCLASGSGDRTIKLWDPASADPGSGQLIFVADAAITALAVLPLKEGQGTSATLLVAGDASGRLHWLRMQGS